MKITSNNLFLNTFFKHQKKEYIIFDNLCILKGYCLNSDNTFLYIFKVSNYTRLKYTYKDLKENKMVKNTHSFDLIDTDIIAFLTYPELIHYIERKQI